MKHPYIFLSFLVVFWSVIVATLISVQNPSFSVYSLQWSRTTCELHNCTSPAYPWLSVHGLWPSWLFPWNGQPGPSFCTDEKLNPWVIESLKNDLHFYWFSTLGNDYDFWSHEWSKHGTCSGLTQLEYFIKALSLYSRIDVQTIQSVHNTTLNKLLGLLWNKIPQSAIPFCSRHDNHTLLSEIHYCLDSNYEFVSCPDTYISVNAPHAKCPYDELIYFP